MRDISNSFSELIGREPNEEEIRELNRISRVLRIKDNDALWVVLIALQHYQTLYTAIPDRIAKAAQKVLKSTEVAAEAKLKASSEAIKEELSKTVEVTARRIADRVVGTQMWKWATGCIATAVIALACIGWLGFSIGNKAGIAMGYAQSRDENAAAAWANTPEGQFAFALAKAGNLGNLARCDLPGWIIRDGTCYPREASDGLHGWRLR